MMRYVVKPRAVECGDEAWEPTPLTMDVVHPEDGPVDTGLLDAHGNRLFRVSERVPLGFVRK